MRRMVMAGVAAVTLLAAIGGTALAAGYGNPQFLVETDWLALHLNERSLRIVDIRNSQEQFAAGHIPGAVYLAVNQIRLALKEPGFMIPPDYEVEEILASLESRARPWWWPTTTRGD